MSGYYEMINTSLDDGLLCLCLGWPGNISPVSLQTRRVTMTPVLLGVSAVTLGRVQTLTETIPGNV